MIVASNLTIAEMILGMPGPGESNSGIPSDPGKEVYDSFKEHLSRIEESFG
jgi:hypothetical protein